MIYLRAGALTFSMLLIAACATTSPQRRQLESDYRACVKGGIGEEQVIGSSSDSALAARLETCRAASAREKAERERRRQEEAAAQAEEKKRLSSVYRDFCMPVVLGTKLMCDERIKQLSKLFTFGPGVCEKSAELVQNACFDHGWDEVINEQDQTTRGLMIADYDSRTVLGACLFVHSGDMELQYATREMQTKCLALADAVKDTFVRGTVRAKTAPASATPTTKTKKK